MALPTPRAQQSWHHCDVTTAYVVFQALQLFADAVAPKEHPGWFGSTLHVAVLNA